MGAPYSECFCSVEIVGGIEVFVWGDLAVETYALSMSYGKEIFVDERGGRGPGRCQGRGGQVKEELFVLVVLWDLSPKGRR